MCDAGFALSGGDASLESEEGSSAGDFSIELAHMLALVVAILAVAACAISGYAVLYRQEVLFVAGL